MNDTTDTDCRIKDGHRYVDGRCVWCDALQDRRKKALDDLSREAQELGEYE